MGTSCSTVFYDEHNREICRLYRQSDGHPDTHGVQLCNFLDGMKIVDGISSGDRKAKTANGMECLAAQAVAHFKTRVGDFYLVAKDAWEDDYLYEVHQQDRGFLLVSVYDIDSFASDGEKMNLICSGIPLHVKTLCLLHE